MLTLYGIPQCSTVKKALKWFDDHQIEISNKIDYREETPSKELLQLALDQAGGNPRKIMNTSGQLYRQLGLKAKLDDMTNDEIIVLLSQNGMLIKRPFITDGNHVTVGANEKILEETWLVK